MTGFKLMNLNEAFNYTTTKLKEGGVLSYKKEARLIFAYILKIDQGDFFVNPDRLISNLEKGRLDRAIKKRRGGYPLQYIFGEWEFYGLPFYIGENVLIPRQDTEILVDHAILEGKNYKNPKIIDLCSGSGCIGITVAKHLPNSEVTLVEYSKNAFSYLKKNIKLNKVKNVRPILGDALDEDFAEKFKDDNFNMILSNPPYIETKDLSSLQKEVMFEPKMAFDGGEDGMKFYKNLTKLWKSTLDEKGCIIYEIGISQEDFVAEILKNNGFNNTKIIKDLTDIPRVVFSKR